MFIGVFQMTVAFSVADSAHYGYFAGPLADKVTCNIEFFCWHDFDNAQHFEHDLDNALAKFEKFANVFSITIVYIKHLPSSMYHFEPNQGAGSNHS